MPFKLPPAMSDASALADIPGGMALCAYAVRQLQHYRMMVLGAMVDPAAWERLTWLMNATPRGLKVFPGCERDAERRGKDHDGMDALVALLRGSISTARLTLSPEDRLTLTTALEHYGRFLSDMADMYPVDSAQSKSVVLQQGVVDKCLDVVRYVYPAVVCVRRWEGRGMRGSVRNKARFVEYLELIKSNNWTVRSIHPVKTGHDGRGWVRVALSGVDKFGMSAEAYIDLCSVRTSVDELSALYNEWYAAWAGVGANAKKVRR